MKNSEQTKTFESLRNIRPHMLVEGVMARAVEGERLSLAVVELEPNDTFSYTALSVIYQRCGRIAEAEHAKAMAYNKQMGFD